MDFGKITKRKIPPVPWEEGEKIPWNDPEFSKRMLKEHISQEHNLASRRFEIIDKHVEWIDKNILKSNKSKILDICCGPGFYSQRLTQLGHKCKGIDFSPASISYAKEEAKKEALKIDYEKADIRTADFGRNADLAMMIYGEFNVFKPDDIKNVCLKAWSSLKKGGSFLIEPQTYEAVEKSGKQGVFWNAYESGLFSDEPHLWLQENFWNPENKCAILRYFIMHLKTSGLSLHSSTYQAYTNEDFEKLLSECGFSEIEFHPSSSETGSDNDLHLILCRKI
jgi:SAM-dependent methyltransferase